MCTYGAPREEHQNLLELELQICKQSCVWWGELSQTWVLCKSSKCPSLLSHLSSLSTFLLWMRKLRYRYTLWHRHTYSHKASRWWGWDLILGTEFWKSMFSRYTVMLHGKSNGTLTHMTVKLAFKIWSSKPHQHPISCPFAMDWTFFFQSHYTFLVLHHLWPTAFPCSWLVFNSSSN